MTTEYTSSTQPTVTKRRRVFAKTFGIPGFVFALLSAWLTLSQSLVAMTAVGTAEIVTRQFFRFTFTEIMNIPVLALCGCALFWACFGIACCVLSRFLGTPTKLNHAGFIISVVSVICSASLGFFSIIYMILV